MKKVIIFADEQVGTFCVDFLITDFDKTLSYIVVKDKTSLVYKFLQKKQYDMRKVLFQDEIMNYQFHEIDYIFLIWWPYIISKNIIDIPKYGAINTHPSLLPNNRGKNYNFWNIVEDVPFGVSLHFVNHGIDSGDIIFQKVIDKTWEDNGESLYNKAKNEMVALFQEKYEPIINGEYTRKTQDLKKGSYHNANELEKASEIFLDKQYNAKDFLNLLRARTFPPYNGCYFYDNEKKYEVQIKIKKVENESN